jgi:hypothetical protein
MHAEMLLDPAYPTYPVLMKSGQTMTPTRIGEITKESIRASRNS